MSTPTMVTTVEAPGGAYPAALRNLRLRLVASTTGDTPGYAAGEDTHVTGISTPTYSAVTGLITCATLRPTSGSSSDVITSPSGCVYQLSWQAPGRGPVELTFSVPDLAGTYQIGDYIAVAPTSPVTTIAASAVTFDASTSPLVSTNVQDAIEELDLLVTGQAPGATPMGQTGLADLWTAIAAGTAQIAVVGDSILELTQWAHSLGKFMAGRYNANRHITQSKHFYDDASYNKWTTTTGAGAGVAGTPVMGASGYTLTLTAGQYVEFTSPEPTDRLSFFYRKSSGAGSAVVKCDGATTDTIATANATTTYSNLATSTAQTLATHLWRIEASGGTIVLEDSYHHAGTTPTSGVTVWSFAHSGLSANETTTGYLANTSLVTALTNLSPTAVVIALGTNDATPVTANMTALIDAIKVAVPGVIIVVAVPYIGATCTSTDIAAIRALAAAGGYPTLDFQALVGSLASTADAEDQSSDSVHPDYAGYEAMRTAARVVLSGDPLGALAAGAGITSLADRSQTFTAIPTTGKITVGDLLAGVGLPGIGISKVASDTQPEMLMLGADFAALLGLKAGIMAGPGGSTLVDTYLYRDSAGTWKVNGKLIGLTEGAASGEAATYAATPAGIITANGDLVVGTGSHTAGRLGIGATKGMTPVVDDSTNLISWGYGPSLREAYSPPAGVPFETVPRLGSTLANTAVLSSGRISMVAIMLPKGVVISTIGFVSATTAADTPTNQWFFIANDSRVVQKFTSNDTTTAWAASSAKVLNLTSSHTTTYAGWHYLGIMVTATTVPTLAAVSTLASVTGLGVGPKLSGTADTGQTTVPGLPFTAAAMTAAANIPYAICY